MRTRTGCKKSADITDNDKQQATVSFIIDGDDHYSESITITGSPVVKSNVGTYFIKWGFTAVTIGDKRKESDANKNSLDLYLDHKTTGAQALGTSFKNKTGVQTIVNLVIELEKYGDKSTYVSVSSPPGNITITKYGEVGDWIEGTFQGNFQNTGNGEFATAKGFFRVPREKDNKL